MKRTIFALLATIWLAFGVAPTPAQAHSYPAYTGAEQVCTMNGSCGSGGVELYRNGRYYLMTVAHVTGQLGSDVYSYHPTFRYIGKLAYKSNAKDIALIDMGTTRHDPSLRISDNVNGERTPTGRYIPQMASIWGHPKTADWPYGYELCTSGVTPWGGWLKAKCGYADNRLYPGSCEGDGICGIRSYGGDSDYLCCDANAGSSGSVVWHPEPDWNIRVMGFMYTCKTVPGSQCGFLHIDRWLTHSWNSTETASGYPLGVGGQVVVGG